MRMPSAETMKLLAEGLTDVVRIAQSGDTDDKVNEFVKTVYLALVGHLAVTSDDDPQTSTYRGRSRFSNN